MAFKMNRPVIKGTANHKASVAKATSKSIVSQRRTQADAGLVGASRALGKSYKPQEIDFELDKINIDVPEKKESKDKEPKDKEPRVKKEKKVKVKKDKEPKVKKEKEPKVKRDTWYRDVDEDGNIISRTYQGIKDKIRSKREQKELDFQAEQEKKNRIQAEKDAAYVGKGEQEVLVENYKGSKEELAYLKEQERLAAEAKKKQMAKKAVIEVEKPTVGAVGEEAIRNYTKDEQKRLQTEGVFNEQVMRVVLPEEQDSDGNFIGGKEKDVTVIEPVVEKKKTTTSSPRQRRLDKKYENAGPSVRANMEADGYVPPGVTQVQQQKVFNDWKKDNNIPKDTKLTQEQIEEFSEYESNVDYTKVGGGKSPAAMRDNRIYRNAIKGGAVQRNMIKSGYKPE